MSRFAIVFVSVVGILTILGVTILDAKVLPVSLDVGVHSMPAAESKEMKAFKRGLSADDRALLKAQNSKTRYIDALLTKKRDTNDRDQDVLDPDVEEPTVISDPEVQKFIATLPADVQALIKSNPSKADSLLDALREVQRPVSDGSEVPINGVKKRNLDESDYQKKIQEMTSHITALQNIVDDAASHFNVGSDPLKELSDKIAADITLAKQKGLKIEDILNSLKTRAMKKDSKD